MRIFLLGRSFDLGGAERQLALAARSLARHGHRVTVAVFYGGGPLGRGLSEAGVQVIDLGKRGRYDIAAFTLRYLAALRTSRPEVVYSHLTVPNLFALMGHCVRPRPAIVWGLRESLPEEVAYDRTTRLVRRLEERGSRYADAIIVNSRAGAAAAMARGFSGARLSVIPNGVDLECFKPDPAARRRSRAGWGVDNATLVIGHVARIDPMKDHDTFLCAIARILANRQDIHPVCIAAGDSLAVENLRSRVRDLGLSHCVQVLPGCDDVPAALNGFDVFCSSSAFGEAFPNAVAEAMACGVPCVVTHMGDGPALVAGTGMVVPPRSPDALAEALVAMCNRQRTQRWPAYLVRERIAPYTPARLAESLEALFSQLVANRAP